MKKRAMMMFAAAALCVISVCGSGQRDGFLETEKVVDTDSFDRILIRETHIDLTEDSVPDTIYVYLLGNTQDKLHDAEKLVSYEARSIQVMIKDGTTTETLYDRSFSGDHIGEGELALVTDGSGWYLFESDCHEQMGYAAYTGEVFHWKAGEKIVVDKFDADFVIDLEAAARNMQSGEAVICREKAIPQFKEAVLSWSQDSELLVACDIINNQNDIQAVYISTDEKQYSLDDYFSSVWERTSNKYSVGTFDELMGYSGYYIYDETNPFPYGYYYANDGNLIAETWGTTENEDFIVDVNQDGVNELVSNAMWADGARATLIYYKDRSNIYRGYADDLLDEEFDNISYVSEYSYYIPEEGIVEIFFWIDALSEYQSKKYEIDLDKINFELYQYIPNL